MYCCWDCHCLLPFVPGSMSTRTLPPHHHHLSPLCSLFLWQLFFLCLCIYAVFCRFSCRLWLTSAWKGGWRVFKWQRGWRGSHALEGIGRHLNYKSSCQTKLAAVEERSSLTVLLTWRMPLMLKKRKQNKNQNKSKTFFSLVRLRWAVAIVANGESACWVMSSDSRCLRLRWLWECTCAIHRRAFLDAHSMCSI